MKKYKDADIEKAKKLRLQFKYSFKKLQEITGIPATTIRNWCKEDFLGTRWDTLLLTNERKRQALKSSELNTLDAINNITPDNAKVFASLIYWCEGSKYPATNKMDLTNSDPKLLEMFLKLLRTSFNLNESKFRVKLQIHNTHDSEKIKKYWSKILSIPQSQFMKPTITKPTGRKYRKEYFGTCTVRYHDYKLQLKLIGIYEEFARNLL